MGTLRETELNEVIAGSRLILKPWAFCAQLRRTPRLAIPIKRICVRNDRASRSGGPSATRLTQVALVLLVVAPSQGYAQRRAAGPSNGVCESRQSVSVDPNADWRCSLALTPSDAFTIRVDQRDWTSRLVARYARPTGLHGRFADEESKRGSLAGRRATERKVRSLPPVVRAKAGTAVPQRATRSWTAYRNLPHLGRARGTDSRLRAGRTPDPRERYGAHRAVSVCSRSLQVGWLDGMAGGDAAAHSGDVFLGSERFGRRSVERAPGDGSVSQLRIRCCTRKPPSFMPPRRSRVATATQVTGRDTDLVNHRSTSRLPSLTPRRWCCRRPGSFRTRAGAQLCRRWPVLQGRLQRRAIALRAGRGNISIARRQAERRPAPAKHRCHRPGQRRLCTSDRELQIRARRPRSGD